MLKKGGLRRHQSGGGAGGVINMPTRHELHDLLTLRHQTTEGLGKLFYGDVRTVT